MSQGGKLEVGGSKGDKMGRSRIQTAEVLGGAAELDGGHSVARFVCKVAGQNVSCRNQSCLKLVPFS